MSTIILVIHLMVALALVGTVLLQRSEGGALGMGGGGGGGGFMSGRGAANMLTRTTAGLALIFFLTSIGLSVLSRSNTDPGSILDGAQQPADSKGAPTSVLPQLPKPAETPTGPAAPISQ